MYNAISSNKRNSVLLVLAFVFILGALGSVGGWYVGDLRTGLWFAAALSITLTLIGYFKGGSIALSLAHAKLVTKKDHESLYRIVENLSIAQGLPTPKVYLIEDPAPNAFAAGRKPETAVVAVSTGLLAIMEKAELEGVLAHELSHIKNYDIRLMTLVIVLVGGVVLLSDVLTRGIFYGRHRNERSGGDIFLIVGLVFALLSPLFAQLLKLAISRQREYLADANGAMLTRYPDGLASALRKIASADLPMRHANHATAHLFLANPFDPHVTTKVEHFFSTHPPIEDRIRRLESMSRSSYA